MRINLSKSFRKFYKKRVREGSSLETRYIQRSEIFLLNPRSQIIKDHALTGKLKTFRAYWVTGDIRVVYFYENNDLVTFVNIGTHNQVYK